eukprot:12071823-Alexandrium_andersonii.AAC.1
MPAPIMFRFIPLPASDSKLLTRSTQDCEAGRRRHGMTRRPGRPGLPRTTAWSPRQVASDQQR